jgi:arylsulfatase A-like enzyme
MTHGDPTREGRHGDEGLKIGREGMDEIFDFIEDAQVDNKPFFIWYAPLLPHAPHTPPDTLLAKYLPLTPCENIARYWAMCEWFDHTCGQLMKYIDQKELSNETLVVYITDNGWIQNPDRQNWFAPRSKQTPYEMGVRTPIIFRWKGMIEPEMDSSSVISSTDIAPTILEICDIEPYTDLNGINILDRRARENHEKVFTETYAHDFDNVKASLYYRSIIKLPWKLILPDTLNRTDCQPELYDLSDDPHEQFNLAPENPEKVSLLRTEIEQWWNE